ncbi:MAG: hypothetical protein RR914_02840 [Oscillospiraceae bacterium]
MKSNKFLKELLVFVLILFACKSAFVAFIVVITLSIFLRYYMSKVKHLKRQVQEATGNIVENGGIK